MPAIFCEPGLFLVKPDGTLFYAALSSARFGRPSSAGMLNATDFIADRGGVYPQQLRPPSGALSRSLPRSTSRGDVT
jgi:hypothetical protein